jgi:drug/metabolite transporter (DMT)-like permease
MFWLVVASLVWAFSFGLIKRFLPGLDPWWVAAARLGLAAVAFGPWLVRARFPAGVAWRALALGGLQFGLMYVCYLAAFRDLAAWQVALWTVLTPLLVVLCDQARRRRWRWRGWLAALLAVAAAMLAQGRLPVGDALRGVLLVQASNLAFALGQLAYGPLARRARVDAGGPGREAGLLGWMYVGGVSLAVGGALVVGGPLALDDLAAASPILLYLGLVPTALGFWAWNRGAARVAPASLAAANNLKIPLAVLVSWTVFGEVAAYGRALGGLAVVVAVLFWLDRTGTKGAGPGR